jgi:tRNA pseudouridine55 synthase
VHGILLIDKPAGITSHDVVTLVKQAIDSRSARVKVGHAGTLDPFATGLLIVLVGAATKSQSRLMALPKRYETVALLGASSTTGDPEGEIVHTGRLPPDPPPLPTGQIRQRPPRHSAVKIDGERAYRRARRGESFELPERTVTVYRFEQLWREPELAELDSIKPDLAETDLAKPDVVERHPADPNTKPTHHAGLQRAGYAIECSSGTYVRSLIAALGDAYCLQLRRTAIGPFDVSEAHPPPARGERFKAPPPIALQDALARLPT